MRFSTTVLASLAVVASVYAQEDQGTTGSMSTLGQETAAVSVVSTVSSSEVAVETSTEVVGVTTTTSVAPVVSGTQSASPAEVSRAACLEECDDDDNNCRAECGKIANAVNPIADCQSNCVKGNGTAADDLAYKNCYQGCIETATTSFAAATTSTETSSSGEATETAEVTATTSGSSDDAESTAASIVSSAASGASSAASGASSAASGAAASATAAGGAGSQLKATFSAAGILGVAAFILAL